MYAKLDKPEPSKLAPKDHAIICDHDEVKNEFVKEIERRPIKRSMSVFDKDSMQHKTKSIFK